MITVDDGTIWFHTERQQDLELMDNSSVTKYWNKDCKVSAGIKD